MTAFPLETQLHALLDESSEAAIVRERSTFDESVAPFERRLVLFGAGNLGRKVLGLLRASGTEPVAFADNAPRTWGQNVEGVPVFEPSEAARRFGREAAFVICIFNPGSDMRAIRRQLHELGCRKVVPFLSLFWKYPEASFPHVQLQSPREVLARKEAVRRVFGLLGDDRSRRELLGQVRWRLRQDFDALEPPDALGQYFPDDLFALAPGETFVDGGAFDGDTIREIIRRREDFRRIVAFEPDPQTYARLGDFLAQLPDALRTRISPRRAGLGAKRGTVRFRAVGTVSSMIAADGDVEIECAVLDDLLGEQIDPTYVKMDIEGAELDALKGAQSILRRGAAIWAICVYHLPEDLWQIPLFLSEHTEGYRFFLRKYMGEVWESVFYAVPVWRMRDSGFDPAART